jgi:hypothetical protein
MIDALQTFGSLIGLIFVPTINVNLPFIIIGVFFLAIAPSIKVSKCLDVSTLRGYVSRDVVFNENIFPFASPHPNTGARLRQEILLLPSSTSTPARLYYQISTGSCNGVFLRHLAKRRR